MPSLGSDWAKCPLWIAGLCIVCSSEQRGPHAQPACRWNLRTDMCFAGIDWGCFPCVSHGGIALLHGSRRVFYNEQAYPLWVALHKVREHLDGCEKMSRS
jgi:hypothetical protein